MEKIAFYDTKAYDKKWFSRLSHGNDMEILYLENKLNRDTAVLAEGAKAVCAFVNDTVDGETMKILASHGIEAVAMRCAGYNNVDLEMADKLGIKVFRVPSYSPSSVAQHGMALLLSLCRKTHKAFVRTRERNFSLEGLEGMDLDGKTVGIVGTGKVGIQFAQMCTGFGMKVIAYDVNPVWGHGIEYVRLDELIRRSDVISLHCPLMPETYHIINRATFHMMKDGVYIINTSRGALIDSEALLDMIKSGKVGAAGLDVYEEEADVFYEDVSLKVMRDDTLNLLLSQPNVLVTSHQAFLTDEALKAIAEVTIQNLNDFFSGKEVKNEIYFSEDKV